MMNDSVVGRSFVVLLVVGAILMTGVAAAATLSAGSGVTYETNSGLALTISETHSVNTANPFTETSVELSNIKVTGTNRAVNVTDVNLALSKLQQDETETFTTDYEVNGGIEVDVDGDRIDEIIFSDTNLDLAEYDYTEGTKTVYDINQGSTVFSWFGLQRDSDTAEEIIWQDSNDNLYIYDVNGGTNTDTGIDASNFDKADTDGDGIDEIVTRDGSGEIVIHDTDGSTTTPQLTAGANYDGADIDDDGSDELAVVNANNDLVLWDSSNGVTETSYTAGNVLKGNVDTDNEDEVLLENSGEIDIYQPESNTVEDTPESGGLRSSVNVGDTDGDGVSEIVVTAGSVFRYDHVDNTTEKVVFGSANQLFGVGDFDDDAAAEIAFDESDDVLKLHDPTPTTLFKTSNFAVSYGGRINEAAVPSGDLTLDDGVQDLYYQGQWSSGTARLVTKGHTPGIAIAAVDGSGNVVDSNTVDAAGRLVVSVPASSDGTRLKLREISKPTVDNANADPKNNELIADQFTADLSIPIDDDDFSTSGDELTVRWFVNGNLKSTETYSSEGLASKTVSLNTVGSQTWSVEVEDKYGLTTKSDKFKFATRADLKIKNVSNKSELVNNVNTTVEFITSDKVYTRTSTTGTFSFDGLPANERFVAKADAPGYVERSVVIPSLKEQQTIYLIPDSKETVEVRFTIDDTTGTFGSSSELFIERALNTSETGGSYQIMVSRKFGVNGVTTTLRKGTAYNLKIRNQNGDIVELDTYTPTVSETINLEPNIASINVEEPTNALFESKYDRDNDKVTVEYIDRANETTDAILNISSRDGEDVLKSTTTYANPSSLSISVPTSELNKTYIVNLTVTRGGETISYTKPVGPKQQDIVPNALPSSYKSILGIGLILLIGGVFSTLNAGVGVLITSLFGGLLWFFGILSGVASGGSVVLAIGVGALTTFRGR